MTKSSSGEMIREFQQALDSRQVFEINREKNRRSAAAASSCGCLLPPLERRGVSDWIVSVYDQRSFSG